MSELIGKCGCNCGKCPAFIGNIKSEEDKEKCSEGWKKYLNIGLKAEKCVCFGCQAKEPWKTGNMLPDRSCIVKRCAEKSNLKTCAHCFSFPCSFLKERSKNDYFREWVEKRVAAKISEEEYEVFVKPYETYKNIVNLRETLKEDEICSQQTVEPLKIKVSDFPEALNINEASNQVLKNTYHFLVELQQCRSNTYVQQTISERRMKPALVILWVFAVYGEFIDNDYSKLVISSNLSGEKAEFRSIIRKRDNNWHGSVEQVAFLLKDYGLNMEFKSLPRKHWSIALSAGDNAKGLDVIQGLKTFAQKLVEKHGTPEYVSSWKYNGNAFKDFERADFSAFENM